MSAETKTKTKTEILQGDIYEEFMSGIRSDAFKAAYKVSLRRYMNYLKITDMASLLENRANPKDIQTQIIKYIGSLKDDGISCNTIKFLVAPIFTFYQTYDITLNSKNPTL